MQYFQLILFGYIFYISWGGWVKYQLQNSIQCISSVACGVWNDQLQQLFFFYKSVHWPEHFPHKAQLARKNVWLWNIMLAFPVRWLVIISRPCYNTSYPNKPSKVTPVQIANAANANANSNFMLAKMLYKIWLNNLTSKYLIDLIQIYFYWLLHLK